MEAFRTLRKEGPSGVRRKAGEFLAYHLDLKWHFVYLSFGLAQEFMRVPMTSALTVRVATPADLGRINAELFPEMTGEQTYETRYFGLLGQDDVRCFVAERDGVLVHYSWVFLNASTSPLMDTPFDRRMLREGDVYVGPVFTSPKVRGFIYPQVLASIVRYLKEAPAATRIVLFVQGKNPAAVTYYKRLRFDEMVNAGARPAWSFLLWKLVPKKLMSANS
ncbi:MAG: hypothetical protein AAB092_04040 [Chloroflexota bacterium]